MKFRQFYLGCLAHASYYIGSEGEAAIIDPQRDVGQYLAEAEANGQTIKYIIETHSHADFVSGHIELAAKTGARIVYGQRANTEFPTLKVHDGDELSVGQVRLTFLETPGHTPEGITILAADAGDPNEPRKLFTGDTLFIGDVGRPDLIGSKGHTAEEMAGMLYDSIREKILPLPDETEVYPAHGAGSLCGKSLSKETWSTLGEQRRFNYALQPMAREDFIKLVASGQAEVPAYFPKSAAANLQGARSLDELPKPREVGAEEILGFEGVVLDVRSAADFGAGHIPGALNIGLGGQFASWAGTLIELGTPIAIAAETREQVEEAVIRLARVGIETVKNFILMAKWPYETAKIEQVPVDKMNEILSGKHDVQFVDVRREGEYTGGHAPGAINLTLSDLGNLSGKLDESRPTYVICQGGYRSSAGASILEKKGFKELYNITGGTGAWINAGLDVEM
jgi:glyoxylase-like metal-dependent hydrolase (beta-lactamase superfamily II)/rhodanese-related sulfurtransferase